MALLYKSFFNEALGRIGLRLLTTKQSTAGLVVRGTLTLSGCQKNTGVRQSFSNHSYARYCSTAPQSSDVIFRQLLDYNTYTYTYILADKESKEAVIIDPVLETVDRDLRIINELGLNLIYAINTHMHADHVTGSGEIKKRIKTCKSVIAKDSKAKADIHVNDGDLIKYGKCQLECRSTPGHTDGCFSFVWHDKSMIFTGDALLIRGCGRTDFQQGDPVKLYNSCHQRILSLPDHYRIYPAHDYAGCMSSTVGEEKQYNPRLTKRLEQFVKIMNELNLPKPKYIDQAVPANMVCGIIDRPDIKTFTSKEI